MSNVKTGQEMAASLANFANNFNCDLEGFVEGVTSDHRTLQQSMFNLFLHCMKEWSMRADGSNFDPRNEFTVKTSKKFMDLYEKEFGAFVRAPFI